MQAALAVLGPLEITWHGKPLPIGSSAARALLAYLALEPGRPQSRERLAAMLWPDRPQASAFSNLRQSLVRMRQALPDELYYAILEVNQHALRFVSEAATVDASMFDTLLAQSSAHNHADILICAECTDRLEQAVALYRGELLHGLSLESSDEWTEWLFFKRESFGRRVLDTLNTLTLAAEQRGDYAIMRQHAQRQIEIEPRREKAHRQLMRALAFRGERGAALAAYDNCRRVLLAELGIEPAAETMELHRQIDAGLLRPTHTTVAASTTQPRWHVPVPMTRLVGRDDELAALTTLLRDDAHRLVTMVGPGGVGKTHLALEVANAMRAEWTDGVTFVGLAPTAHADMVISAIAQNLNIPQSGGQSLRDALIHELRSRHMLLVLDNFEQVVDAAPVVADILANAPHVSVVVTSRTVLRLRGEYEYAVTTLAVADLANATTHEIAELPSVQLFVERAHAVRPTFDLTADNAHTLASICALLDGLPLAIELAAARIRIMGANDLLRRLRAARLPVLTAGARDLPARHQTLRDAIEWSYRLLDEPQQHLFARLSVFAGSWNASAAQAICEPRTEQTLTLERVRTLLDQSLIARATNWDVDGRGSTRFSLLETIREYARLQLDASGEREAVLAAHADYYLVRAEETERMIGTTEQGPWMSDLDAEEDNLRQALEWFLRGNDADKGLRLAAALVQYWARRGLYSEGRAWVERALEQSVSADDDDVRAHALYGAAWLASLHGENARASQLFEESLAAQRNDDDPSRPARMRVYIGRTARLRGDYERAALLEEEALALFRAVDDKPNMAFALLSLGDVQYDQGNLALAAKVLQEALALYESLGNAEDTAWSLKCLGEVAYMQGRLDDACRLLDRAMLMFRDEKELTGVAQVLLVQGQVAHLSGDDGSAVRLFRESLSLLFEYGIKLDIAFLLEALPTAQDMTADHAALLFGAAAAIRHESELPRPPIFRPGYERAVAALRARLTPAAFDAAWHAGATAPLADVVAFALGQAVPPSASA